MYSTCLFCHSDLGRNQFIEHFEVGRRLAFDAAKGRLWVVCRRCERWNLTPVEERWEAVEECERAYSETKLRVATDQIGLARTREGLELVRIGAPKRPEMAAWRYGDQFGRRRRLHLVFYGAPSIAVTALLAGDMFLGGAFSLAGLGTQVGQLAHRAVKARKARTRLRSGASAVPVGWSEIQQFRIIPTAGQVQWSLVAPQRVSPLSRTAFGQRHREVPDELIGTEEARRISRLAGWPDRAVEYRGDDAISALRKILPFLNLTGGSRQQVNEAVDQLQHAATMESYFALVAKRAKHHSNVEWSNRRGDTLVGSLPPSMLLALEMAAHEETERQAMEGELARLEDEWRDADEIAAIADNMFLPEEITKWIGEQRSVDLSVGVPSINSRKDE